jgi:general secretion pathway protein G
MERNIVTGKGQAAPGSRQEAGEMPRARVIRRQAVLSRIRPSAACRLPTGFTLLELMIVITVIIILAAIVLPQYQKTILSTREAVLRDDLFRMRSLLDQYAADKQKLPQTLDDLVSGGYLRELPKDPITGQPDWTVITGEDPNSSDGEQGVTDVHSASTDVSSEGTHYSEW